MKHFICLVAVSMSTLSIQCDAAQSIPIASRGATLTTAIVNNLHLKVEISTHEVNIGKPSDGEPPVRMNSCTYSKFPCSVIDSVTLSVAGDALFVPRSSFCDLADLNSMEVLPWKKGAVLVLHGGDASESYVAKIDFDANGVHHRVLSSAMSPEQPLQETNYYSQDSDN